jgi:hypothetical protein
LEVFFYFLSLLGKSRTKITHWNIGDNRNIQRLQNTRSSYSGPLEHLWGSKSTSGDDDKFVRLDNLVCWLGKSNFRLKFWIGLVFDADSAWWRRFVKENSNDLGLNEDVEVGVLAVLKKRVNITMGRVLTLAVWADVSLPSLGRISQLQYPQDLPGKRPVT